MCVCVSMSCQLSFHYSLDGATYFSLFNFSFILFPSILSFSLSVSTLILTHTFLVKMNAVFSVSHLPSFLGVSCNPFFISFLLFILHILF